MNKVPENIDILVISDVRTALSPKEQEIIENYIAEGRNLLIAFGTSDGMTTFYPNVVRAKKMKLALLHF